MEDSTLLVVDDIAQNVSLLKEILRDDYRILQVYNGREALDIARDKHPDLIILDIMMPEMDGFQICRELKNNPATEDIPVILMSSSGSPEEETRSFTAGAEDYLVRPVEPFSLKARVRNHLNISRAKHYLQTRQGILQEEVGARTRELELTRDATLACIASIAETRDNETGKHISRTREYMKLLTRNLIDNGVFPEDLDEVTGPLIYKSAVLHDIGKVGVPDHILLKPGRLTEKEFEEMKLHTVYGRDALRSAEELLGSNSYLHYAAQIAGYHHERWDGGGYPEGLFREEIPLAARMMAIADVYDAMISRRIYKPPFPHSKAYEIITTGSGSHFDPAMVESFIEIHQQFRETAIRLADDEQQRSVLVEA